MSTKDEAMTVSPNGQQTDVISSIIRVGYVSAMNGNELWANTETDEIVKFVVKDRDLLWKYYCGKVRVTIELLEKA
jgi:hypothetical protein